MFKTTWVKNNQTEKPMVNPERDNVAIYEAPTFLNEGKGLGFQSERIPWLMDTGNISIGIKPK